MRIKSKQNKGLRMTRPRRVILAELQRSDCHPTAAQVYRAVRERIPRISLGTIYRNLDILFKAGLIQKLELAGKEKRFDGTTENHYHVRCVSCGRVEDVSTNEVPPVESTIQGMSDYEIVAYRLEYIGICPECRKRRGSSQRKKPLESGKEKSSGTERIED